MVRQLKPLYINDLKYPPSTDNLLAANSMHTSALLCLCVPKISKRTLVEYRLITEKMCKIPLSIQKIHFQGVWHSMRQKERGPALTPRPPSSGYI